MPDRDDRRKVVPPHPFEQIVGELGPAPRPLRRRSRVGPHGARREAYHPVTGEERLQRGRVCLRRKPVGGGEVHRRSAAAELEERESHVHKLMRLRSPWTRGKFRPCSSHRCASGPRCCSCPPFTTHCPPVSPRPSPAPKPASATGSRPTARSRSGTWSGW